MWKLHAEEAKGVGISKKEKVRNGEGCSQKDAETQRPKVWRVTM